jgi:regulatory protein
MPRAAPKPVTATYLRNVVRWYLERHDTTAAHLRRLLMQRVHRAAAAHGQDPAEGARLVDALLGELVASGLVDDRRYAEQTARRLRDRGQSARKIRAALAAKGLRGDVVEVALAGDDVDAAPDADPERLAAIRYARRRRLGPWRRPGAPDDVFRKELASLARAGFGYDVALDVLKGDAETLEAELPVGW